MRPVPAYSPRLQADPTWRDNAACAEVDPELFFPPPSGDPDPAIQVCSSCPVAAACLTHALTHREAEGIWGGLTERARDALRKETGS